MRLVKFDRATDGQDVWVNPLQVQSVRPQGNHGVVTIYMASGTSDDYVTVRAHIDHVVAELNDGLRDPEPRWTP